MPGAARAFEAVATSGDLKLDLATFGALADGDAGRETHRGDPAAAKVALRRCGVDQDEASAVRAPGVAGANPPCAEVGNGVATPGLSDRGDLAQRLAHRGDDAAVVGVAI